MERLDTILNHIIGPRQVCIVAAGRTPIDKTWNKLSHLQAVDLAGICLQQVYKKHEIPASQIQHLYLGNVFSQNLGQNLAKQVAVRAGLPDTTSCMSLDKLCASGMKAVMLGALSIASGDTDLIAAGGVQSMSNTPYILQQARQGFKRGDKPMKDLMLLQMKDHFQHYIPADVSDRTAEKRGLSKQQLDDYALLSYQRTLKAWNEGKFNKEVIKVPLKKGGFMTKDTIKGGELIRKAKPIKKGPSTIGNSVGINDGSSMVILASRRKVQELGLTVLGSIIGLADVQRNGWEFPMTPAQAILKALDQCQIPLQQVDCFQINQPFATVILTAAQMLNVSLDKINKYGGSISIGHPIGSTGCRILVTLLNVMEQQNKSIGAAGICNAGSGGSALIIRKT